ncbi:MAG: nucleotidyltransferase domain-containing protein [Candidatus Woesearchaeota archaeon]
MLKKEYELLVPFIRKPWKKFAFKEIKKSTNKTSESYVYNGLKRFVRQGILKEERAGNVILYFLFLGQIKTQVYVGFAAEHVAWGKKHIPFDNVEKIAEQIPTTFYILIITGSYAKNKQTLKSDIDMVIIVDDAIETKKVYAALQLKCEMNIPPIHPYVFKREEFLQMLLNKEANYGKAIALDNLILYGGAEYLKMMDEAIQNGFNDKNLS